MPKLTKRIIDTFRPDPDRDVFTWDSELRGFGVRIKPSGAMSYLIQYRNAEGRSSRLTLGKVGTLTPDEARALGRSKLADVAKGSDPVAEKKAASAAPTVAEICNWYLENARAGRILGRKGRPIKASTLALDNSRIEMHVKPLIGSRRVKSLTMADLEGFQADIVAGKTAKARTGPRGGNATGGPGVAGRTAGMLHTIFAHAKRLSQIDTNPAAGQRKFRAPKKAKRRLSLDEIARLGAGMREAAADHENRTGIGAIRLLLLTGFRRMEGLGLKRAWVRPREGAVYFPDTKSDFQIRAVGSAAVAAIKTQPARPGSEYVFPADIGDGHFIGVVRVLQRVCKRAKLTGVTPHTLRHTFASVAGDLGFSELTIAGLLGHAPRGVTQHYIHLDAALVVAANQVSAEIARALDEPVLKRARPARATKGTAQVRLAA